MKLDEIKRGDRITIELESGEVFEDVFVSVLEREYQEDSWDKNWLSASIEGGLWEQVKDRVDSEVIDLRAEGDRGKDNWTECEVFGHVWVGEPKDSSLPEYVKLGDVKAIHRIEDDG